MDIVNFGSLNNDYVFRVNQFVQPGETIFTSQMDVFPGGKGLNQSVAIARAGGRVCHAGYFGRGGESLRDLLSGEGIDCSYLRPCNAFQGQAFIQVDGDGQNCIVVYGGSNQHMDTAFVDEVLSHFGEETIVLLQNEVSCVAYIIRKAFSLGMQVAFNPSPMDGAFDSIDPGMAAWLLLNEVEGGQITGKQDCSEILAELRRICPQTGVVLTLGGEGAYCSQNGNVVYHEAYCVPVVDTTAAGDTFTGYFIAEIASGASLESAVRIASAAAALCVSGAGASPSIPYKDAVKTFLGNRK